MAIADRALRDPAWWCQHVVGDTLWGKQIEIIESVRDNPRTAVRSCHGSGKTWTASRTAAWFLLTHLRSKVITTAPTFRQVEHLLWAEINAMHLKSAFPLGGKILNTEWKLEPGWFAFGAATDDPDKFQGVHAEGGVLVIIDEAGGVAPNIWAAVEGNMTNPENCRLLAIGNPTDRSTQFYREFTTPGTHCITISAMDTPNFQSTDITHPYLITRAWADDKAKRWGIDSPMYRSRVLAEFPDAGTDTLIPLSRIEAARARTIEPSLPTEIVVDVARFGGDESVIGLRRGDTVRTVWSARSNDLMELAGHAIAMRRTHDAETIKVDSIGLGAGVVDRLKEVGESATEMNASHSPIEKEKFANARAEWFWLLRERFISGEIDVDPDDDELAAQLSAIKYKMNSRGQIQIESKDDMKKRGLQSPDRADMLAMAFGCGRDTKTCWDVPFDA
jgi:hypothetical protein